MQTIRPPLCLVRRSRPPTGVSSRRKRAPGATKWTVGGVEDYYVGKYYCSLKKLNNIFVTMLLVIDDDHKEHLSFLTDVSLDGKSIICSYFF